MIIILNMPTDFSPPIWNRNPNETVNLFDRVYPVIFIVLAGDGMLLNI